MSDHSTASRCSLHSASLRTRAGALGSAILLGSALVASVLVTVGALPRLAWAAPQAQTRTIGDSGCATIQACINTSADGDTIIIPANRYTESLTLNKAVSLLGAAASTTVIHALDNQRVMTITGANINGSAVISGLTLTGGLVTGTASCPESCGGGLLISDTAQPRLLNLTIANNLAGYQGGGLYANTDLNLTNVQLISNTSQGEGGGALVVGAVTVQNGLFQGNTAIHGSGGGLETSSTLAMTDTRFISNTSGGSGGGALANGAATLQNGLFKGNTAIDSGGGLGVLSTLALIGTQVISNTASMGGGVYAFGAVTLQNGLFQSNTASMGGGVYAFGVVTLQNGLFQGNVGRGLTTFSDLTLTGTQFISNTDGGAGAGGMVTLQGGLFQGNTTTYSGGGLSAGTLVMSGTQFISNTSQSAGGGVDAAYAVTIQNGLFQGNACTQDCMGGGLYTGGTLAMTGTQFISNTADSLGVETVSANGGGVSAGGAVTLQNDRFQGNVCRGNTGSYCPGGGLFAGNSVAATGTPFIDNYADTGGGGLSANGAVTIQAGLFQGNKAADDGGGLLAGGALMLSGTQFISNATYLFNGGGVEAGAATIEQGLFQGNACGIANAAPCSGGGLAIGALTLTSTQFISNTATDSGGGLWQGGSSTSRVVNALFAGNSADTGGAALALGSSGNIAILHTTIGSATVGGGSAIAVLSGTVNITNTIIASYTVGISRTAGTVVETNNLFFGNGVDTQGGVSAGGGSLTGDPQWVNPAGDDYEIGALSAARGRGLDLGIATDFEGDPRPQGRAPDIGFDQYRAQLYLPLIRR